MNKTMKFAAVFAAATVVFAACDPENIPTPDPGQTDTTITENPDTTDVNDGPGEPVEDNSAFEGLDRTSYVESEKRFPNPERGFYFVKSIHSAEDQPVLATSLRAQRSLNRTILYLGCYLTDYMESDIAQEYLDLLRNCFQVLRDGGAKCVLRFAYKNNEATTNKPWDASPEWVARHIEQVKPLLNEYSDILLTFQAGYVGVWGEWYYTDHFVQGPKTPEDHALRKAVVDAMLDAIPKNRSVALRTPMFTRMMYANDYKDTLTIATAYKGSDHARIGAFNDCFGASSSDMGTFEGSTSREFWKKDTRYVLMGGETCAVSSYCRCEQSLKDLKDYHWTYLNSEYNGKVYTKWRNEGCYEEVERRLGYRLSLYDVFQTPSPAAGSDFRLALKIRNTGWAAPMNPRAVEIILVDGNGNKTVYALDDVDPRYWFAGERHILDKTIKLPADASGKCILYLNLPDPEVTLHDNPLFSIRLANDGLWDETTGYNKVAEFTL